MYAIVDIETTGGNASESGITEIAIILLNGTVIENSFQSLINPERPIPKSITALTGINDYMVADAPTFPEIAPQILALLQDRIFIAHNVNFDYSFIVHHLRQAGFIWQAKKLCTVRYARKVIPGYPSYSLGKICTAIGISIENRHRAMGDAIATAQLFNHLRTIDHNKEQLAAMLKGKNPETYLPMHCPAEQLEQLPYCPGVYYFNDQHGKIIYVGKAVNLKFRVRSHFTNNTPNRRKQVFAQSVYQINYQACATELMAIILESLEIKKWWPLHNRSQKKWEPTYGLYAVEDRKGRWRLVIEKKKKQLPALYTFTHLEEGFAFARKAAALFEMDEQHIFASNDSKVLFPADHNLKMKAVINHLRMHLPTFAVVQKGSDQIGRPVQVVFLVEKGAFVGMGEILPQTSFTLTAFREAITRYPENDFIRNTLIQHATRYPHETIHFDSNNVHHGLPNA